MYPYNKQEWVENWLCWCHNEVEMKKEEFKRDNQIRTSLNKKCQDTLCWLQSTSLDNWSGLTTLKNNAIVVNNRNDTENKNKNDSNSLFEVKSEETEHKHSSIANDKPSDDAINLKRKSGGSNPNNDENSRVVSITFSQTSQCGIVLYEDGDTDTFDNGINKARITNMNSTQYVIFDNDEYWNGLLIAYNYPEDNDININIHGNNNGHSHMPGRLKLECFIALTNHCFGYLIGAGNWGLPRNNSWKKNCILFQASKGNHIIGIKRDPQTFRIIGIIEAPLKRRISKTMENKRDECLNNLRRTREFGELLYQTVKRRNNGNNYDYNYNYNRFDENSARDKDVNIWWFEKFGVAVTSNGHIGEWDKFGNGWNFRSILRMN